MGKGQIMLKYAPNMLFMPNLIKYAIICLKISINFKL